MKKCFLIFKVKKYKFQYSLVKLETISKNHLIIILINIQLQNKLLKRRSETIQIFSKITKNLIKLILII